MVSPALFKKMCPKSVPKYTANLYCICLCIPQIYIKADAVKICGKFWDTQYLYIYTYIICSILTNFADERRVNGHHVLMPGNMTISRDASVTVDLPYEMYETEKGDPSLPRQWKSSGWYRNRWVSSNPGSRQLKDWKLKDYDIFVEVTSNDFGQSEGACDGLC